MLREFLARAALSVSEWCLKRSKKWKARSEFWSDVVVSISTGASLDLLRRQRTINPEGDDPHGT